jgi:signal recognition particle GTPase
MVLGSIRNFGVTDSVMGIAQSMTDGKKEKQFEMMLKLMAESPKWNLRHWKKTMDEQLSSWTQYIPGVSGSDEMKELKGFMAILNAMTPDELENPEKIKHPQKERIARATNKPIDHVQKLLHYFNQSCIIAEWLQMKKKANETLPTNEQEMTAMQAKDPRVKIIAQKVLKASSRKSGRGRRAFF